MSSLRTILIGVFAAILALALPADAQDSPARRLGNVVGVAMEEYATGVDASGTIVLQMEYDEAVAFLADAREITTRITDGRGPQLLAVIQELAAGVERRVPPAELAPLQAQLIQILGPDASLEYPRAAVDIAEGREIYRARCASCHGDTGMGDGPAAIGLDPPAPALGDPSITGEVTPALMYRIVSVGVQGTSMAGFADLTPEQRWAVVTYVTTLRAKDESVTRGRALLASHCATCGDSLPPEGHSFPWLAERSDVQVVAAIAAGDSALGLDAAAASLADDDALAVVAAMRADPRVIVPPAKSPQVVAADVMTLVDRALDLGRRNEPGASDLAFDAYVTFNPLEALVMARDPGLVTLLEQHFANFKGALQQGDITGAERARLLIATGLPQVVDIAERPTTGWGSVAESFLIILREGFEAILILGAIIAFLVRTGNAGRVREIWMGAGVGLAASLVLAVLLRTALANAPASREVIEGATMLLAVGVLFSVSYWLLTKVEAKRWKAFIDEKVGAALTSGRATALALVAFLAVFREGAETALFYQAILARGPQALPPMLTGLAVGSVALIGVWIGIQYFGLRLPLRAFFSVTSSLLYTLAFIFMGKGLRELQEGNVLSITPLEHAPYVGWLGIYPSAETLIGQGVLVALAVYALIRTAMSSTPPVPAPRPAPVPAAEGEHPR